MHRTRSLAGAVVAAAFASAVAAAPAAAQAGHSLALSGPGAATTGQPITLTASGVVPPDAFLNRYVNVYAIPTSVTPSCPTSYQNAIQLSYASSAQGGETVANTVPAEGNFSLPIAYTPRVAGSFLLCGYLHEGVETMATATHGVTVSGGGGSPSPQPAGERPAATKKPKVKRSGRKLTCARGTWSGAPTGYAYKWKVDGKRRTGATKRTLRITRSIRGSKVRCGVTARNGAGARTVWSGAKRVR